MKLIIKPNDIVNGSIKKEIIDANFEKITYVSCIGFPSLKELPSWPNVITVHCHGCIGLKKLPLWPNVRYVYCQNCTDLEDLPLWPNITLVDCQDCKSLVDLPLWPNVTCIYCYDCPGLIELPLWPKITIIGCSSCRNLKNLQPWPNITEVYCHNTEITRIPDFKTIKELCCSECPLKQMPLCPLLTCIKYGTSFENKIESYKYWYNKIITIILLNKIKENKKPRLSLDLICSLNIFL